MRYLIYVSVMILAFVLPGTMTAQNDNPAPNRHELRKAAHEQLKKEIKEIKTDPNLSEEQKETLIKEKKTTLRKEFGKGKGKGKGKIKGKKGKHNKGKNLSPEQKKQRAANKAAVKKELDNIDANDSLTEEEKIARKKAVKQANKEKRKAHKSEKMGGSEPKGKGQHAKSKKDAKQGSAGRKAANRTHNKPAKVASKKLDRKERKLAKKLKKGKITTAEYEEKMAKIALKRAAKSK